MSDGKRRVISAALMPNPLGAIVISNLKVWPFLRSITSVIRATSIPFCSGTTVVASVVGGIVVLIDIEGE